MSTFYAIRQRLGLTQASIAEHLGVTQGSVSFYETGKQTLPPRIAVRLIELARAQGHELTFSDVYDAAEVAAQAAAQSAARQDATPVDGHTETT